MVKEPRIYASSEETIDMAVRLYRSGTSPIDALALCKAAPIKGINYFGIAVANHMQLLYRLNAGIKAGKVKCTKSKGLVL